ncbi:SGNH/GDSL hydrolase family protein [Microcoleus sp. LEGE 07076]|uniref:SGNH/GDSL hydrolase family protein n=1 Tax=Microcoleus sp. LEGE 07076 TaxID=915322 RepID=UPI001D14FD0E|nr:SGNH/GDSL hydrolase family protein [Microcoleus sp. LEGE 07076]
MSTTTAEIVLRVAGYKPWQIENVDVAVEPKGNFFTKDSELGYKHLPGKFKVTLNGNYSFNATHLNNSLRITHPLNTYNKSSTKPEIWIFGCSFTYGWSLNDSETYAWLLQQKLPAYEIVNFGVNGYGTLHSFIQFKAALKQRKKPKIAVIAYAKFHDRRNTLLRARSKQMSAWNKLGILLQPDARLNGNNNFTYSMTKLEYHEWPLMRVSALVNLLEVNYNQFEEELYQSHEVSKAVIAEFNRVAEANNVKLVVAGINAGSAKMLEELSREGIATVDISVDLKVPGNNNLPHDIHPSAVANRQYAEKLDNFLQGTVLK